VRVRVRMRARVCVCVRVRVSDFKVMSSQTLCLYMFECTLHRQILIASCGAIIKEPGNPTFEGEQILVKQRTV
jgi:hypothetical protein